MPTLEDLGEREIVRSILPRYASGVGDDCCIVRNSCGQVVVTSDPVPVPAAEVLGNDSDPFWAGYLLVTINASDLAAAGARGSSFLAAIEVPRSFEVKAFERLLAGIRSSCNDQGLTYCGGNLREASELGMVGTAVGFSERPLGRSGATPGDAVVSIGLGGQFWRDVLVVLRSGKELQKDKSPVFRPGSQVRNVFRLAETGYISAAIDNSDGLIPTLQQLAEASEVQLEIDVTRLGWPVGPQAPELDPARLWLGWGDWNVIASVRRDGLSDLLSRARNIQVPVSEIGRCFRGSPKVLLRRGDLVREACRLESERFTTDSWFSAGIEQYVESMLRYELP